MATAALDCEHAGLCPGCALIGLAPAAQLAAKHERVMRELRAIPVLAALAPEPVRAADPAAAYRTRAKLAVGPGPRLGLFARGTHDVVDLPGCRILAPPLAAAATALRRLLAEPPADTAPVLRAAGDRGGRLRAVDLREVRDEHGAGVLLTLVVQAPPPSQRALGAACDALRDAVPALRAIALSLHDGRSPQLLGRAPRVVRGPPLHRDAIRAGAPWTRVAPGSFAQAHRAQAGAIHAAIEASLGDLRGRRLLDVFAGSGALGLALAARGAAVVLVESFAPAAEAARGAAREQALAERVRVVAASAEQALPRLAAKGERFDAVILNPPRRGVAPLARAAAAALCDGPLVYVSCEPATLARDLAHWAWLGRTAVRIAPFDLMPQTAEVECVAWLERAPAPAPPVLFEDGDVVAVDAPPFAGEASGVALRAGPEGALVPPDTTRWIALLRGAAERPPRGVRRLELVAGHALVEIESSGSGADALCRRLARAREPVAGDERHGHAPTNRHLAARAFLDRPFLHRGAGVWTHPRTGAPLRVEAPLAPDLAAVLTRLRQPEPLP